MELFKIELFLLCVNKKCIEVNDCVYKKSYAYAKLNCLK